MRVTCSDCGREFKVPESAAGKRVRCPDCDSPVPVPRQRAAEGRPAGKADARRGKTKTGRRARGVDRRVLIGAGVAGVVLLAGVVWGLVSWLGGPEDGTPPVEGLPANWNPVVFDEPLPDAPGPEPGQPWPGPSPQPPTSALALLPEASAGDAIGGGVAAWGGEPDPADDAPEPLPEKAFVHLRNEEAPLLASLGGPFVLEHRGNWSREPDQAAPGGDDADRLPLEVKDLRTGEVVGRFAKKVPVWPSPRHTLDARLSPDARYIVGPDNKEGVPATRQEGLLFVWEREKTEPVGQLRIPGPVLWIDFVADDKVAALTFDQTPVLQVWDVAEPDPELSVPLPAEEFARPQQDQYTYQPPEPGAKTYAPDPMLGAVSPAAAPSQWGAPRPSTSSRSRKAKRPARCRCRGSNSRRIRSPRLTPITASPSVTTGTIYSLCWQLK